MSELALHWFAIVVDVTVKSILLAAVTGLTLACLRVRNSSIKHAAWTGVLVALIALPVISPLIPGIQVPLPRTPEFTTPVTIDTEPRNETVPLLPVTDPKRISSNPDDRTELSMEATALPTSSDEWQQFRPTTLKSSEATADDSTANVLAQNKSNERPRRTSFHWMSLLSCAAIAWLVISTLLIVRLIYSIGLTRRLVNRSTAVSSSELPCHTITAELGLNRRSVGLRETELIYVPLTTGSLHPSIILPADWRTWSPEKLTHVLFHEFSHVQRGDCWIAMFMEIVASLYWFHPLAWWLRRRLAVLAEECCDDAAIGSTGNRAAYARHLLEIASVLCHQPRRLNYAGLAMTRRSQVERRILTILDLNRPLSERMTWTATLLVTGLIVSLVSMAAALKPASNNDAIAADRVDATRSPGDQLALAETKTSPENHPEEPASDLRVHGRVVDSENKAIAGAKIAIRKLIYPYLTSEPLGSQLLAETITDPDGRFEKVIPRDQVPPLSSNPRHRAAEWLQVSAIAPGHGVQLNNVDRYAPDRATDLQLIPETLIRGRIINLEGRPVAGARIRVLERIPSTAEKVDAWHAAALKNENRGLDEEKMLFQQPRMKTKDENISATTTFQDHVRTSPDSFLEARTDVDGKFVITGIPKDHLAILEISGPNIVQTLTNVVARPMKPVTDYGSGSQLATGVRTFYGCDFDFVASPGITVRGQVRDIETKKPLVGALVSTDTLAGTKMARAGFITTRTDAEGRYEISGLPPTKGNSLIVFPGTAPYLNTGFLPVPASPSLQPVDLNLELRRAVWVTGRVFDRKTNKPVQAKIGYTPFVANPFTKDYSQYSDQIYSVADNVGDYHSDSDGRFRIPVIPGRGILSAKVQDGGFIAGLGSELIPEFQELIKEGKSLDDQRLTSDAISPSGHHAIRDISPAADATETEVDLPVDSGVSTKLSIIDADGKPAPQIFARGIDLPALFLFPESHETTLAGLIPGKPVTLWFQQQSEKPLQRIQTIVADESQTTCVIRLEKPAHITGRLLDSQKKPIRVDQLTLLYEAAADKMHRVDASGSSSDDGHFEIDVPVGGKYRLTAYHKRKSAILAEHLQPEPGQTIDLGDLNFEAIKVADKKDALKDATAVAQNSPAVSAKAGTNSCRVHGRIADSAGKLVAGALIGVIGVRNASDGAYVPETFAEAVTNQQGEYDVTAQIDSSKSLIGTKLIVRASGHALGWQSVDLQQPDSQINLALRPEQLLKVRLIDTQGQPAASVAVDYIAIAPAQGKGGAEQGYAKQAQGKKSSVKAAPPELISDADGLLTIPYVPADHGIYLSVRGTDRFAPQDLQLNTGAPESRPQNDGTYRPLVKNFAPNETPAIALAQAQIFEGVVLLGDTGKPAAKAKISIWSSQQDTGGSMISVTGETDADGRFRLNPLPGVRFGIKAYPPRSAAYQIRELNDLKWETGQSSRTIEIRLPAGTLAKGTIVDASSGKPLANASVQYYPDRVRNKNISPNLVTGWQGIQRTDDKGQFEIPVLSGPGTLVAHAPLGTDYVLRQSSNRELDGYGSGGMRYYAHAFQKIDPASNDKSATNAQQGELDSLQIRLQPGATVAARLVDSHGNAIQQAVYTSRLNVLPTNPFWRAYSENAKNGIAEIRGLEEGVKYPVFVLDAKNQLGSVAEISLDSPQPTITLKPCASAKARYVDPKGKPIKKGMMFGVSMVVTPGRSRFNQNPKTLDQLEADADFAANFDRSGPGADQGTDANGVEKYSRLIPGATYRYVISYGKDGLVEKEFVAESGKEHDLGQIVVELK